MPPKTYCLGAMRRLNDKRQCRKFPITTDNSEHFAAVKISTLFTLTSHLAGWLRTATTAASPVTLGDTLSLGEVTVTAIKQSADMRSQATALTVIGRQEAERNQVQSVKTAADLVPNLFIPDYGSRMTSTVYVRGIGTRIDQPAVGLTIDNVPVMTKENYDFDLTDLSRFEMLRGPQSTLYGRNTLGGLMNVYTLSPLSYQGTRAVIEGASHGTWRVGASHYRLLGDDLGVSLSAQYNSTQGEFTNRTTAAAVTGSACSQPAPNSSGAARTAGT